MQSILVGFKSLHNFVSESQVFLFSTFLLAATDTTSSALSRTLSLLAENLGIQSKLRDELTTAHKERGDFDYDMLQSLPYLDAVCRETLRVYPPVASVSREYAFPLTNPFKNAHRFNSL